MPETPHALRIETTLPTWQIITSFGLVNGWSILKTAKFSKFFKSLIIFFSFLLMFFNFIYFQHVYWRHYSIEYSGEWQFGYKPAIEFLKNIEGNYDEIWFTDKIGRPYIYFLFYLKKSPIEFQKFSKIDREVFGFVHVRSFGKYHFFGLGESLPRDDKKILYVDSPEDVPEVAKIIKTFNLLNGKPILTAYEL